MQNTQNNDNCVTPHNYFKKMMLTLKFERWCDSVSPKLSLTSIYKGQFLVVKLL